MGKNKKKGAVSANWEDTTSNHGTEPELPKQSTSNAAREEEVVESPTPNLHKIKYDGGKSEGQGTHDALNDPEFDTYFDAMEGLQKQIISSQTAFKTVHSLYQKQKRGIQEAGQTRQQLRDMTKQCQEHKAAVRSLKLLERENDERVASKMAEIEEDKKALEDVKKEATKHEEKLEEDRRKFEKSVKATEAEQKLELQKKLEDLENKHSEEYEKRVKVLEEETKSRQESDKEIMTSLEGKNNKLSEKLEEEKSKLEEIEHKCMEIEMLKNLYETKNKEMEQKLKRADNEFELNTQPTEYYEKGFLQIYNTIRDISSQYINEAHIVTDDLDTVHDSIEQIDVGFTSVPISSSEVSRKLCVAHAKRVISSQLQDIIWQPFSSDITMQDPKNISLLSLIWDGLANSTDKRQNGPRAAKICAALVMRSLQSQSTSTSRAERFTDNVMAVLSLLVKSDQHENLRNDLISLATAAVSLWDTAQTDEREIKVHDNLNSTSSEEWDQDAPSINNEIIVLFPRITALRHSRITDTSPVGATGKWADLEPELSIEETCIHEGEGLPEWSELVVDGEEEEEERKDKQEEKILEERKRILEEDLKKLEKPSLGQKRKTSYSRRESVTAAGSSPSSPTTLGMKGARQRLIESDG